MAGGLLTTMSKLQCPHGGTVQIISSNTQVKAGTVPLALSSDTFTVMGCPFQIPATPPIPSPCVTVRWVMVDLRSKSDQGATLSQSSVGLCLSAAQVPQGPVSIVRTQTTVESS
jgi:hypothetical protein